jgi:hypothetical protein
MSPEQWNRIEAKRERNRYFATLEYAAAESQRAPVVIQKPKKRGASWGVCTTCERPMRPRTASAEENPGRVVYGGRGLCSGCSPSKQPPPDACQGCKKPMRRRGRPPESAPGTVAHWANGLCRPCWRGQNPTPRKTKRRNLGLNTGTLCCIKCQASLRGARQKPDAFPFETRRPGRREGDGYLCWPCMSGGDGRREWPRPCGNCGAPLVSRVMDPEPGQKRHAGGGLCGGCKTRARREKTKVL